MTFVQAATSHSRLSLTMVIAKVGHQKRTDETVLAFKLNDGWQFVIVLKVFNSLFTRKGFLKMTQNKT